MCTQSDDLTVPRGYVRTKGGYVGNISGYKGIFVAPIIDGESSVQENENAMEAGIMWSLTWIAEFCTRDDVGMEIRGRKDT